MHGATGVGGVVHCKAIKTNMPRDPLNTSENASSGDEGMTGVHQFNHKHETGENTSVSRQEPRGKKLQYT